MLRAIEKDGTVRDEYLIVRYGATLRDWEEAADETRFVELLDGQLIMHSPISLTHARIFGFFHVLLAQYVESRKLGQVLTGPFAMELTSDRVFEPDLMFLTVRTSANLSEDRLMGAADFAIEIASPSTKAYDRTEKREAYRVGGIREYWMIDPYQHSILVDRPAGHEAGRFTEGIVTAQLCPGFFIRAEWLWADPLPQVQTCLSEILACGQPLT